MARGAGRSDAVRVEGEASVAHRLPILYRDTLDAITALERGGARSSAGRLRREAQLAYACRWDEEACRHLSQLADRARDLAEEPRQRRPGLSLRPVWLVRR
jgi:hypothetical protein